MHSTIESTVDAPAVTPAMTPAAAPAAARPEALADALVAPTVTVCSLHVARTDLDRLRRYDCPLPCRCTPGRIWLGLADDGALQQVLDEMQGRGYSTAFLGLLRWAASDGARWLLIDDAAEPDDKLLLFVG